MRRWLLRIGGIDSRRMLVVLVVAISAVVAADTLLVKGMHGLHRTTYDAMVRLRLWAAAPDPRIVIVDIDEQSLADMAGEFGRWPWPRDTLATLLAHLERNGAAAIVWDVLVSDLDRYHPGGDAALDAAAVRSRRSHFPVVRLPAALDESGGIDAQALPGLWTGAPPSGRLAVIPPALAGVAASRLGYNNTTPDPDGVLRRFRFAELRPDGSVVNSLALSVATALDPERARAIVASLRSPWHREDSLLEWRRAAGAYPRVPFGQVFRQADAGATDPSWAGRIAIIGSTAIALHDYHPTPVAPHHPGVDILATAIDNALNHPPRAELPPLGLAAVALVLCWCLAWYAWSFSIAHLEPLLVLLPAALVALTYASLHWPVPFLELQGPAAAVLGFLAALRVWTTMRRAYWCGPDGLGRTDVQVLVVQARHAWTDAALDRLIDVLERHAPGCRIVVPDMSARWPARPRWPELARYAAVVGPESQLQLLMSMEPLWRQLGCVAHHAPSLPGAPTRGSLAVHCLQAWARLATRTEVPA